MKYINEIEINKSVDKVIALFDNSDNLEKWMEGLQSFVHIKGIPGQVGSKSLLKFKVGKREIEMIETITVRNLPHEFSGTYESKGVFNTVKNKFIDLPGQRTKYVSEQEFKLKGFMKLFGLLMPGVFKKQSMKYLTAFKSFAEKT